MKQQNNKQPFETWLRAYAAISGYSGAASDSETELVFSKRFDAVLPVEKADALLASLTQRLSRDSLGSLVHKAMTKGGKTTAQVLECTGMPPSLMTDIQEDMTFPNSIPVRSLVKMLHFLQISLDDALAAIHTTFERLRTENNVMKTIPAEVRPIFRRGNTAHQRDAGLIQLISDESYLYKNREALAKYTTRLSELYHEML